MYLSDCEKLSSHLARAKNYNFTRSQIDYIKLFYLIFSGIPCNLPRHLEKERNE